MIEQIKIVENFHVSMGLTVNNKPTWPSVEDSNLRLRLMQEELAEVQEEIENGMPEINYPHIPNLTKEIADLLVVTFGTIVTYGLQDKIVPVFDEIMRANNSKLDDNGKAIINGKNGVMDETKPIGKVLKSKNFKPADVTVIFND